MATAGGFGGGGAGDGNHGGYSGGQGGWVAGGGGSINFGDDQENSSGIGNDFGRVYITRLLD